MLFVFAACHIWPQFSKYPWQGETYNAYSFDIKDYFAKLSTAQVGVLLKLILVMPATNACSFSALRRVKTYFMSTMTQNRLNNLWLLHIHKEYTDSLDLNSVTNRFIGNCPVRRTNNVYKYDLVFDCFHIILAIITCNFQHKLDVESAPDAIWVHQISKIACGGHSCV